MKRGEIIRDSWALLSVSRRETTLRGVVKMDKKKKKKKRRKNPSTFDRRYVKLPFLYFLHLFDASVSRAGVRAPLNFSPIDTPSRALGATNGGSCQNV